ncbi:MULTISPECIES: hypothetical protein [Haloferacaceae]|jgi:hypothetical protein|uniref:Uncharacterized protein n=1 Tax=Halopelagius inordinatus TaxID=553467 RepID=A0A1I2W642_9EURY|nr:MULTISPECIES: hypothetical protein [Haloferacaceae]MDS0243184.1 hypothetical protein [Haloferax sp. S2CR25]MDS0446305.1 hypothetical protein [Haloferax sp. S2CR25-2]SFG96077.1 hypothetical protein SAMN04488063_3424 [Halopelagius inordinatus]
MEIDLRTALVGSDRKRSLEGVLVAAGVSALVLVISLLPLTAGAIVEPGLVIIGFGLASWWAYDNSGLAVSMTLMLAPVVARLTYYWWLYLDQPSPVALPLSFGGVGAWEMWVPLALLLGVIAFGAGVILRWGHRFVARKSRPVA